VTASLYHSTNSFVVRWSMRSDSVAARVRRTYRASFCRSRPKKCLCAGQLATGLSDLPVAEVPCKHWAIGLPEVAEALASVVCLWNSAPEPCRGLSGVVPNQKRYDPSAPTAETNSHCSFDSFRTYVQHSSSSRTSFSSASPLPSSPAARLRVGPQSLEWYS
jgi:hypothetical protein